MNFSRLEQYRASQPLFSRLMNSTCTVQGSFTNVNFSEQELTELLVCRGHIVAIDSNFGHRRAPGYQPDKHQRKSNRGRKKKPKNKNRKFQGDGSGFNSQISFTVLGRVTRPRSEFPDKYTRRATILDGGATERFIKEYKIKVFRNGAFTVPGILTEDLSDIVKPLRDLAHYFSEMFLVEVEFAELYSVMYNYKFRLSAGRIDMRKLHIHFQSHFVPLVNIRFQDFADFLCAPGFLGFEESSPIDLGWRSFADVFFECRNAQLEIDIPRFRQFLCENRTGRNLNVNLAYLIGEMQKLGLRELYTRILEVHEIMHRRFVRIPDAAIQLMICYSLMDQLRDLNHRLVQDSANMLSHIKYDPEKYPGFIIKVKTPTTPSPDKRTTIKIFPGGKINVDGSNGRAEAELIYWWLNSVMAEQSLIYYE